MKVFISFSGGDRDLKNRLKDAINQALCKDVDLMNKMKDVCGEMPTDGNFVWESDEGCTSDFSEECIKNIKQSQVFVVIVSESSMSTTSYVINEVIKAKQCEGEGKLNIIVYKVTDAPYTEKFEFNLNHISDVNHVGRGDEEKTTALLIARIKRLLKLRLEGNPEKPMDVVKPKLNGISMGTLPYFVPHSRDDVFENIAGAFAKSNILFLEQFNGYGRRSTIRKYAQEHASDYDEILTFPFFQGNIKDFFLTGLQIENVNENAFENLREQDVIVKKVKYLQNLDERTLLIVPNLVSIESEDEYVYDILSSLSCRIVFMAEHVSKSISERFNCVSVGRMKQEYLEELFFHHYSCDDDAEKEIIRPQLIKFFDYVGGHTKSVEILAKTIDGELVIYADDVVQTIEKLIGNKEDELADRIRNTISSLFDISKFDDDEKAVLFVATLFAEVTNDDRQFLDILKYCEINGREALKKLSASGWLNVDRVAHTISIDPFILSVCKNSIPKNDEIAGKCFKYLLGLYDKNLSTASTGNVYKALLGVKKVLAYFGLDEAESIVDNHIHILCHYDVVDVEDTNQIVPITIEKLKNAGRDDIIDDMVEFVEEISLHSEIANSWRDEIMHSDPQMDIKEKVMSLFDGIFDLVKESLLEEGEEESDDGWSEEESETLLSAFEMLQESANMNNLSKAVLAITQNLQNLKDSVSDGFLQTITQILGTVCMMVIRSVRSPYVRLGFCRAYFKLIDTTGFDLHVDSHIVHACYISSLIDCDCSESEIDKEYARWREFFIRHEKDIMVKKGAGDIDMVDLGILYAKYKMEHDSLLEAKDLCLEILPNVENAVYFDKSETCVESVSGYFDILDALVGKFIESVDTESALSLIENILDVDRKVVEVDDGVKAQYENFKEIYSALKNPHIESDFEDRTKEYLDYYRTYSADRQSLKLLKQYNAIADEVMNLEDEYAACENLLEKAQELRENAKNMSRKELTVKAFALVRENSFRVLGYRQHYVQIVGAAALADGKIAEILNGEGKTCTIVMTAFLFSLLGKQVHILDNSEYLTERNYNWMKDVFEGLGCRVGLLTSAKKVNCQKDSCASVFYLVKTEAVFNKLRTMFETESDFLRYDIAIADEADNLLIEDAEKNFVLSSNNSIATNKNLLNRIFKFASALSKSSEDYFVIGKFGNVTIKEKLLADFAQKCDFDSMIVGINDDKNYVVQNYFKSCLYALFFAENDKDYFVKGGEIFFENKTTGELYSNGSEYAYFLGMKENLFDFCALMKLDRRAAIDSYNIMEFFAQYEMVCGATATAVSMKKEFKEMYGLDIVCVPPNIPIKRIDHEPLVFVNENFKLKYLVDMVKKRPVAQPVLIVSGSISESERISGLLDNEGIKHNLLNAKNADDKAEMLGNAGKIGTVTVTTAMANRGVDIMMGGDPRQMAKEHLRRGGYGESDIRNAMYGGEFEKQRLATLCDEYKRLCALYKQKTDKDREQIDAIGGVMVVGTECFVDLRTEQQTRGRCGRQGASGQSHILYSFDDAVFKMLIKDSARAFYQKQYGNMDEPISLSLFTNMLRKGREVIQNKKFKACFDSNEMRYFAPERRKFLGTYDIACNGNLRELVEHFLSVEPSFAEDVVNFYAKKTIENPKIIDVISQYFPKAPFGLNKRIGAKIFADAVEECVANKSVPEGFDFSELVKLLLGKSLRNCWMKYIELMNGEIGKVLPVEKSQREKYLAEQSNESGDRLLKESIKQCVQYILYVQVSKNV